MDLAMVFRMGGWVDSRIYGHRNDGMTLIEICIYSSFAYIFYPIIYYNLPSRSPYIVI